jgi:sirohydrochlorin cobaltochelatase
MPAPIVLTASGTSSRADATYRLLEAACRSRFPGREIRWAFASDRVRELAMARHGIHLPSPEEVLGRLEADGHRRVLVQSVHLICGEEFHRVVRAASSSALSTVVGRPLLSSPGDLEALAGALAPALDLPPDTLALWVGHGTRHPAGLIYDLLDRFLRDRFGDGVRLGVLQGSPPVRALVDAWPETGRPTVRLLPFMLVAGAHARKDVDGDRDDSVRRLLEGKGARVEARLEGLLENPEVRGLFCDHIARGLSSVEDAASSG